MTAETVVDTMALGAAGPRPGRLFGLGGAAGREGVPGQPMTTPGGNPLIQMRVNPL